MKNIKLTKKARNLLLAGLIGVTLSSPIEGKAEEFDYREIYGVNYEWNQEDFIYEDNYGFIFESGYIIPEIEQEEINIYNVDVEGNTYTYQDTDILSSLINDFGDGEYDLSYSEETKTYTVFFTDEALNQMEYEFQEMEEAIVFASINNADRILEKTENTYYGNYSVTKEEKYVYPEIEHREEYHGKVKLDDYETTYSKSSFEEIEAQIREDFPNTERYYTDEDYYETITFYNVYGNNDHYQVSYDEMLEYAKLEKAYEIEEVTIYSDTYLLRNVKTYTLPDINNISITEVQMYIDGEYNSSYRDSLEEAVKQIKLDYPDLEYGTQQELGIIDNHYDIYYESDGENYSTQAYTYDDMVGTATSLEAYQVDYEEVIGYRYDTYTKSYVLPVIEDIEMYSVRFYKNGEVFDTRRGSNYETLVNDLQTQYPDIQFVASTYTGQSEVEYRLYYKDDNNQDVYETVYSEDEIGTTAENLNSHKIEKLTYMIYDVDTKTPTIEEYTMPEIEYQNTYQLDIFVDSVYTNSVQKATKDELKTYLNETYVDYTQDRYEDIGVIQEGYSVYYKDNNNEPGEMHNLSYEDMGIYANDLKAYRIVKSTIYGYNIYYKTKQEEVVLAPIKDVNSYYIKLYVDDRLVDTMETLDPEEFKTMINTNYKDYELVSSIPVGIRETFYEVYYKDGSTGGIDAAVLEEMRKDPTVLEIRKVTVNEYEYSIKSKVEEEYKLPKIEKNKVYTVVLYIDGKKTETIEKTTLEDARNYFATNYSNYQMGTEELKSKDEDNYTIYYKEDGKEKEKSYTSYDDMIRGAKKYKAYRIVQTINSNYRLSMSTIKEEYQMPQPIDQTYHTLKLYIDGKYVNGYEYESVEEGIREIQNEYQNYTNITLSEGTLTDEYYRVYYLDSNNSKKYKSHISPDEVTKYAKKYNAYKVVHVTRYSYKYTMDTVTEYVLPLVEEKVDTIRAEIYLNGEGILQGEVTGDSSIEQLLGAFDGKYNGIYTHPEEFSKYNKCLGWSIYVGDTIYNYDGSETLENIQQYAKDLNATRIVKSVSEVHKCNVTELLISDQYQPEIITNNTYRLVVKEGKNGREITNVIGTVDELNEKLGELSKLYNLEQGNKYASAGYWRLYYNDNGIEKTIDINSTYGYREMLKYAESIGVYKIDENVEYTYNYIAKSNCLIKTAVLIGGSLVVIAVTALAIDHHKTHKKTNNRR